MSIPAFKPVRTYSQPIFQCIGKLDIRSRPGFLHMVTRNRNRVEFRHIIGCIVKMSAMIFIDISGGKIYVLRTIYSFKISFWIVPASFSGVTPVLQQRQYKTP